MFTGNRLPMTLIHMRIHALLRDDTLARLRGLSNRCIAGGFAAAIVWETHIAALLLGGKCNALPHCIWEHVLLFTEIGDYGDIDEFTTTPNLPPQCSYYPMSTDFVVLPSSDFVQVSMILTVKEHPSDTFDLPCTKLELRLDANDLLSIWSPADAAPTCKFPHTIESRRRATMHRQVKYASRGYPVINFLAATLAWRDLCTCMTMPFDHDPSNRRPSLKRSRPLAMAFEWSSPTDPAALTQASDMYFTLLSMQYPEAEDATLHYNGLPLEVRNKGQWGSLVTCETPMTCK